MIHVLDNETINKIAAGEVVEKPLNVVKELVENAIDAESSAITVEIKGGGIDYIRVTDNGKGIPQGEVKTAFLRHATSKIASEDDLAYLNTLGFRGEALASIAAVSSVEMTTKTEDQLMGVRICIEGGEVKEFEEIGAPCGTTIVVRNLFFNVPPRKKFLKSPTAEAASIVETVQHMALSMPGLSFKLIVNGSVKFLTSGNGELKEVIYRIFGKNTSDELIPIMVEDYGIRIEGYLGRPVISRSTRADENYYVNHRYIRSKELSKGIEEGYKEFLMMHRFPFCVLHFNLDPSAIDVNIHPSKMEIRMDRQDVVVRLLAESVHDALIGRDLIPQIKEQTEEVKEKIVAPEPFEVRRREAETVTEQTEAEEDFKPHREIFFNDKEEDTVSAVVPESVAGEFPAKTLNPSEIAKTLNPSEPVKTLNPSEIAKTSKPSEPVKTSNPYTEKLVVEKPEQYTMFETEFFREESKEEFEVIGQIFDTYWIIALKDRIYYMDQHAAHEKVKYEEFMKKYKEGFLESQNLLPPIVVDLKPTELEVYRKNREAFANLAFEVEEFGSDAVVLRSVPSDLFGYTSQELFRDILKELTETYSSKSITTVEERIATRACKAAIKGNTVLTKENAKKLIEMLFTLDNPYQCPHGRPTLVSVSKYEIEKLFKRIV
ncbi:MAG: DNA mismatch repair endonuclease MutL [Lachnospiraceae bacterium]|nr:DNA mismatch repair endonuclease MutL [Lachnospiraceae bacterium]